MHGREWAAAALMLIIAVLVLPFIHAGPPESAPVVHAAADTR